MNNCNMNFSLEIFDVKVFTNKKLCENDVYCLLIIVLLSIRKAALAVTDRRFYHSNPVLTFKQICFQAFYC